MPGTVGKSSVKRKRHSTENRPSKRSKSESVEPEEEDAQSQILLLESKISTSKKHHDKIPTLIQIIKSHKKDGALDNAVVAAVSLCRAFLILMATDQMTRDKGNTAEENEVAENLKKQYLRYKTALVELLLLDKEPGLAALTMCKKLLVAEGKNLLKDQSTNFPVAFLKQMVWSLLKPGKSGSARTEFSQDWIREHDDIRFYTLQAIEEIIEDDEASNAWDFDTVFEILKGIDTIPEAEDELEDFFVMPPKHDLLSLSKHKKKAQAAWLALMNRDLTKDQRKALLEIMADLIAPWFSKPELLMDFLTDSFNSSGSVPLLALSGLFYLMQERNLDYPLFYYKLYSLLDRDILHSKHRSKFLRLLDTFLSSTHLPAVLVASFVKRLARLALNAPPAGLAPITPWIYNILKKHPTCTFMIHRVPRTAEERELLASDGMSDPFLMDEEDPMETHAIDSCLWEIVTLQSHYQPNLATLAKIISEQFTKNAYNLEDFLDHSYNSMLEAFETKDIKMEPHVEFEIPKKIFTMHSVESGLEDSLTASIWGEPTTE